MPHRRSSGAPSVEEFCIPQSSAGWCATLTPPPSTLLRRHPGAGPRWLASRLVPTAVRRVPGVPVRYQDHRRPDLDAALDWAARWSGREVRALEVRSAFASFEEQAWGRPGEPDRGSVPRGSRRRRLLLACRGPRRATLSRAEDVTLSPLAAVATCHAPGSPAKPLAC